MGAGSKRLMKVSIGAALPSRGPRRPVDRSAEARDVTLGLGLHPNRTLHGPWGLAPGCALALRGSLMSTTPDDRQIAEDQRDSEPFG